MTALPDMATAGLVIVTYNSSAVLGNCLASVEGDLPIVVVDNGSTDETVAIAQADNRVTVVSMGRNAGFGTAMNRGVSELDTEFAILTNPDLTFAPDFFDEFAAALTRNPDAGAFSPFIDQGDGRAHINWTSILDPRRKFPVGAASRDIASDVCIGFASGACLCVRRTVFLRLGGFDEAILLYYEDDDLARQYMDAREDIVFVPRMRVHHLLGQSSGTSFRTTRFKRQHFSWSRIYVMRKYGMPVAPGRLVFRSVLKMCVGVVSFNSERIAHNLGDAIGYARALFNLGHGT